MAGAQALIVDGVEIHVEGSGPATVVMIHGWPDTWRLWDATVAHLVGQASPGLRCVRFTLPGFDVHGPMRPMGVADLVTFIQRVVDAVSPDQPVFLLLHDWGCVFGYQYAAAHAARVRGVVAVDVGDHLSRAFSGGLSAKARWQIFAYQIWLALAWGVGRRLVGAWGDGMTRYMARAMRCRTEPARIGWHQNYPYVMQWTGAWGGFRGAVNWRPHCPVFYLYGRRKPFMFHSAQWLERVRATPGGAVAEMPTGHWVMVDQPQDFNWRVGQWLEQQASATP